MKVAKGILPTKLPKKFDELQALHALRPIRDSVDLENATEAMDRLAVLNRPTRDQSDYLQTLSLLVNQYEVANDSIEDMAESPVDVLKYLMEQNEMTQTELGKLLGVGTSATSMLLGGTRSLTADHARVLATRFRVSTALFI